MNEKSILYILLSDAITLVTFILCVFRECGSLVYLSDYFPELLIGAAIMFFALIISNILYVLAPLMIGCPKEYKFVYAECFGFCVRKDVSGKIHCKRKPGRVTYNTYMVPPDYDRWQTSYVPYVFSRVIVFWTVTLLSFITAVCLLALYYNIEAFYCFCAFSWFIANALLFTLPDGNMNKFEKVRKLKSSSDLRRAYWMSETVYANLHKGIPVGDQPEEYFDCSYYENTADSLTAEILWLKMNRLIDEGKLAEADKIIDVILDEKCPFDVFRKHLSYLDRITIKLLSGCSDDIITDLLSDETVRFLRTNSSLISVIRTDLVLALLYYRDSSSAENYRKRFEKTVKAYACPADLRGELRLLQMADELAKHQ